MSKPPKFYLEMRDKHPDLMETYEKLGEIAQTTGPLDEKQVALVKLSLALGAGLEGAAHSSVRKARSAGCTPDEIRHVAILGVTTLGFPSMMRARSWVEDVLSKEG